jgi:hypothetical protein
VKNVMEVLEVSGTSDHGQFVQLATEIFDGSERVWPVRVLIFDATKKTEEFFANTLDPARFASQAIDVDRGGLASVELRRVKARGYVVAH